MDNSKSKKYWKETAAEQTLDKKSRTHSDDLLPKLETMAILSFLDKNKRVLEIGCGACDNSIPYMKKSKTYLGVDLIEDFIKLGNEKIENDNFTNAALKVKDGFAYVKENDITEDVVITQRFIINLKDRETQIDFFKNLKNNSKGQPLKIIMCEGFVNELANLNNLRNELGLNPIKSAHYNNFLDKYFISDIEKLGFKMQSSKGFDSFFFITRLFNTEIAKDEKKDLIKDFAFNLELKNLLKFDNSISYSKVFVLTLN